MDQLYGFSYNYLFHLTKIQYNYNNWKFLLIFKQLLTKGLMDY